jgi:hypothetical protein
MADSNSLVSDRRPCEAVKYLVLTRRLKRGSALNIISGAELRSLGLACGIIKVGPLRSRAAGDKEACKQKRHPHASLAFPLARPRNHSLGSPAISL